MNNINQKNSLSSHNGKLICIAYFATFTNWMPFILIAPFPSWICPNKWSFGLIFITFLKSSSDPAWLSFAVLSSIPNGGPWVIKISTFSGIVEKTSYKSYFFLWKAELPYLSV